jgi:hypothetical protein
MEGKAKKLIINGLIISLPVILMSVLIYVFEKNDSTVLGWLTTILFAVTIFFVQRNFRDSHFNGYASYGQLFGNTLLMMLIAMLIFGLYTYLFYKIIAPEQIDVLMESAKAILYQNDMLSDDQIETTMEMQKKILTPAFLAISNAFSYFFWGVIIDLIASIINKRNRDSFQETMKEIADSE